MIKFLEPEILLKCRKEDMKLLEELVPECEKEYAEIMLRETDQEYNTKLTMVEGEYLTNELGGECGGIIMMSLDRKIVCSNTLKGRLDLCFEELLPEIRNVLFPLKKQPKK